MADYGLLLSINLPSELNTTLDGWYGGDIISMPIYKQKEDYESMTLNGVESNSLYAYTYAGSRSEFKYARCCVGNGSSISSVAYFRNQYYSSGNYSITGALVPTLIRKNTELYNTLINTYGASFLDGGEMPIGKYVVKNVTDLVGQTSNSYIIFSGFAHHYCRMYYPLRNVKINNISYDWISPHINKQYGYESYCSFGLETFDIGTLYGWESGSRTPTKLSLKFGDIIEISEKDMLPGWESWLTANTDREYSGNINIFDFSGNNILFNIENTPKIISSKIDVFNNYVTIDFVGENTVTYSVNFPLPIVENRNFVGLSFISNSVNPYIPFDNQYHNVSIPEGDVNLYLSYSRTVRPILDSVTIELYANSAEHNRVDKSNFISHIGTLNGVFREDFSITDLSISIEYNKIPDFNYIYIPSFNRYYFVTDVVSERYGLWDISLTIDVLMSYKDSLSNLYAFIDRNEFMYSKDIVDRNRVVEQGYDIETVEIENNLFSDYVGSYLITGLGFEFTRRS